MNSHQNKMPEWLNILLTLVGFGAAIYVLVKLLEALSFEEESEKRPRVFISHSWTYDEHFNNVVSKLGESGFNFYNHSISKDRPLDIKEDKDLEDGIRRQMQKCSKVVVLAGHYVDKSEPIKLEIRLAQEMGKELLAIKPWGQATLPKSLPKGTKIVTNSSGILSYLRK